jgi:Protein of unknown function (DUF1091)
VGINDFKLDFNSEWANLTSTMTKGSNIEVRQNFELSMLNDVANNLLVGVLQVYKSFGLLLLNFQVNFKIDKLLENGKYEPTFINFKREACQVLKQKNVIFDAIANSLKKLGVLPTRCPIKKGSYYMRNFKFDAEWFPGFVPHRFLRSELNITHKPKKLEIFLLYIRWHLEIVKK